jgi:hypothetical protein
LSRKIKYEVKFKPQVVWLIIKWKGVIDLFIRRCEFFKAIGREQRLQDLHRFTPLFDVFYFPIISRFGVNLF